MSHRYPGPKKDTGYFKFDMVYFRPIGIVPISAKLGWYGPKENSDTAVFKLDATRIVVNFKKGDKDPKAILNFYLLESEVGKYIFSGIVFSDVDGTFARQPEVHMESLTREKIPSDLVGNGDPDDIVGSHMEVTLYGGGKNRTLHDYVLLVQDLESARVGIIDPDIETVPGGD